MRLVKTAAIISVVILAAFFTVTPALAENLDSTNYRLIDPGFVSTDSKGETSTNYQFLGDIRGVDQTQINSALYGLGNGHGYTFMANVPLIACFTATDGAGGCSTPLDECGTYLCYDRARVEIDPQGNPSDTLYTIEISPNNWTTVYYLDGATHYPETSATHTLADYHTEAQWESSDVGTGANVFGLQGGVTYKVRARALQGDFTESPNSPEANTTLGHATIDFDLDVGGVESSSPFSVKLRGINVSQIVSTSEILHIDLTSNALGGVVVFVRDSNNGLYSPSQNYTIPSNDDTLDLPADEGYGLVVTSVGQTAAPGYLRVGDSYPNTSSDYVGGLDLTNKTFLCSRTGPTDTCSSGSGAPIEQGAADIQIRAKARIETPAVGDFSDKITFNINGTW